MTVAANNLHTGPAAPVQLVCAETKLYCIVALRYAQVTFTNRLWCIAAYLREADKVPQSPVTRAQLQQPLSDFTLSPRSAAGRTSGAARILS